MDTDDPPGKSSSAFMMSILTAVSSPCLATTAV